MPRLERVGWEAPEDPYQHDTRHWPLRYTGIQVTLAGEGWVRASPDSPRQAVPPGHAVILPIRSRPVCFGKDPGCNWQFLYANLGGPVAEQLAAEIIDRWGLVVPLPAHSPALRVLLDRLPTHGHAHQQLAMADSARLSWDLLCALSDHRAAEGDPEAELAEAAIALMRERLGEDLGVAGLARVLGVSREHLSRIFRQRTGLPPAAWLRRARIEQAVRQLRSPGARIGEVALACGFKTASHFVTAFRAATGRTPGAYRGRGSSDATG